MYSYSQEYLSHHGVKGQRWGVRRYQNEDGTLKNKEKKPLSSDTKFKIGAYSAAGTAFLAGAGASLLVRKIKTGSIVSGGYVVKKGQQGIKYRKSVGATVTKALLTGALAALTVGAAANIVKAHKDKKENGGNN
ncbi:hypothetical protein [Methanobrevibacter sp.]|uniref:DUF7211 domain-containing protein n=1 Tax=Methanobrevibacter sp. TaxID=66852 RepID=UPI00388FEF1B